jgi:hypothetical protein
MGLTTPGNNDPSDVSDVGLTTPDYAEVSPVQLPIRGEKRIVPNFVQLSAVQDEIDTGIAGSGDSNESSSKPTIGFDDFVIKAALTPFVDYVTVRIPHRGLDANGAADVNSAATFRFLINPENVQVNKQTVDYQTMTRAGWQFGIWGEDVTNISISGKTAGQYFSLGLTDAFHHFTQSFRNLQQLIMMFENNGYFFEGEEAGEGPLAADFTRRRIKMHQDVELTVGNFVWFGMFDSLHVSQDAESPFITNFNLTFLAWKERFRSTSPYWNDLENNSQQGHSYGAYENYGQKQTNDQLLSAIPPPPPPELPVLAPQTPAVEAGITSPAVEAANFDEHLPSVSPVAYDFTPMVDVFNPVKAKWGE